MHTVNQYTLDIDWVEGADWPPGTSHSSDGRKNEGLRTNQLSGESKSLATCTMLTRWLSHECPSRRGLTEYQELGDSSCNWWRRVSTSGSSSPLPRAAPGGDEKFRTSSVPRAERGKAKEQKEQTQPQGRRAQLQGRRAYPTAGNTLRRRRVSLQRTTLQRKQWQKCKCITRDQWSWPSLLTTSDSSASKRDSPNPMISTQWTSSSQQKPRWRILAQLQTSAVVHSVHLCHYESRRHLCTLSSK